MRLRRNHIFGVMIPVVVAGMAISLWPGDVSAHRGYLAAIFTVLIILLILLRRSVTRPLDVVEVGMDMLAAQDFNSHLRKVGEVHADKMVELYNRMVSQLRNERLRLSEQQRFLKLLVDNSPMGVVVLDFDYNITMVNSAFLNMAQLPGKPHDVEGRAFARLDSELVAHIAAMQPGEIETIQLSDHKILRISKLWFMESGFRRPFVLVESMTQEVMDARRRAYEKLIRIISHEINNSMAGVISLLEMMIEITPDNELQNVMESGAQRCRDLSGFIRKYADIVKLPEPVLTERDIAANLSAMLPFLSTLTGPQIEMKLDIPSDPVLALIDSVMFQQVVINIIKNAADSIGRRIAAGHEFAPRISITVISRSNGGAELDIADNGSGIDLETSRKLFTPFFTTRSDGRGGIGLTLIAEILNRHGATYSLRTESDNITHFRIVLS